MQSENMAGAETSDESQGIENLGELLQDFDGDDSAADEAGESDGSPTEDKLTKFNDLAGKVGLELDDLYKLEVSQADDGTPVTIENLKDAYAKQDDVTLRELQFEERRTQQEAELLQAQNELRDLLAALPEKARTPEVLQKLREKHDATVQLERKRTLEVISEWQDENVRAADMQGMIEHLQQYGYGPDYLGQIADHRQLKYIRDNWQREQRIRKALERVKAGKPNPVTRSKPAGKAPTKGNLMGVKRGTSRDKLEAVFSQLD